MVTPSADQALTAGRKPARALGCLSLFSGVMGFVAVPCSHTQELQEEGLSSSHGLGKVQPKP